MATYMLLAGSDPAARPFVEEAAARLGFPCRVVARGAGLSSDMEQPGAVRLALILLDLDLPDADPLALLRDIRDLDATPIIVLASSASADLAKQALHEGASDYLMKPLTVERVEISMRNALKISVLEEEVARLKRQAEGKLAWSDIIAVSPEMQRVVNLAKRAAAMEIPALIEGESGTGRTFIAKTVHAASNRAGKKFLVLDPREQAMHPANGNGAHPPQLEALWAEAEEGTLFIREIGELNAADQERLAGFLARNGKGSAEPKSGPRLFCSSSVDLIEQVKNRQFREDLYYLVNVFPIWIPPLRDRPDDLAHLVWHYVARFSAEEGKRIQGIHPEALALLRSYSWPGNVRQLENAVYRAVILAEGDQIRVHDLPQIAAHVQGFPVKVPAAPAPHLKEPYRGPAMFGSPLAVTGPMSYMPPSAPIGIPVLTEEGEIRSLTEIEADLIRLALGHYRGHITEAARRLGIGRSTLYRKMREFGLDMRHNSV
jgi:DNA-binding NtrC family response regulator